MSTTSNPYFKSLTILHGALLIGQVLFIAVAAFKIYTDKPVGDESLVSVFRTVVPVVLVAGIAMGTILYKAKMRTIKTESDLDAKLKEYRSISMVRWAMMEGPVLFAIVTFLITGNETLLALSTVGILAFVFVRPTKKAIVRDLELNSGEETML